MGVFEEIGKIASPIKPVVDFLAPEPVFDNPGGFMNTLSRGLGATARNSMLGAGRMLPDILGSQDLSAKQKLLFGGMIVGGGAMGAREAHKAYRFANPKGMVRAVRMSGGQSGGRELVSHGDPARYGERTDSQWDYALANPGLNARQLAILSSSDEIGMIDGVRLWDNSLEKDAAAGAVIRRLIDSSDDLGSAQSDLAMFGRALEVKGLVLAKSGDNARVRDLWKRLQSTPESFLDDPDAVEELVSHIKVLGVGLNGVSDDLSTGVVGRVSGLDFLSGGNIRVQFTHPKGWTDGRSRIETIRAKRLAQLNVRQLSDAGKANIKKLWYVGKSSFDEQAETGTSAVKRLDPQGIGLELGDDWYRQGQRDVIKVFKIGKVSAANEADVLFRGERKGSTGSFFTNDKEYARRFQKDAALKGDAQMVETPMPAKDDLLDIDDAAADVFQMGAERAERLRTAFDAGEIPDEGLLKQLDRDLREQVNGQNASRVLKTLNTIDKNSDASLMELLETKGKKALHQYEADGSRSYFFKERPIDLLDSADREALDRALAAVSFLSEAEDWSTNIVKAKKVLDLAGDSMRDPVFQRWLRNGPELMTKKQAKDAETEFNRIWNLVKGNKGKGDGFKVYETDMKKILRLYGGVETVQTVLRSMDARKQRNFYLNLRFPDLDTPVTIDRHAFDAFLGFDSGLQDRPINKSVYDGDQVYDVIADAYRDVARELSEELGYKVLPNQVQAVVWETWRVQKRAEGLKNGWKDLNPYVMTPDGTTPNVAYEALLGRGSLPAHLDTDQGVVSISALEATTSADLGSITMPSGAVVMATGIGDTTATTLRNQWPSVKGVDGVPRWSQVFAAPIRNFKAKFQELKEIENISLTTLVSADVAAAGGHPAIRGGDGVLITLPEGKSLVRPRGYNAGQAVEIGRVAIDSPDLLTNRLGAEDITSKQLADQVNGPLATHQWAAISAELDDKQLLALGIKNYSSAGARNELQALLVRKGYKPIPSKGVYDGDEEDSFLIFGISPTDALEIGDQFGQDSVLVNNGFLYNTTVTKKKSPPPGTFDPISDVRTGLKQDDYRTSTMIGGKEVQWAATGPSIGGSPMDLTFDEKAGRTMTGRQVWIPMNDSAKIAQFADELDARGIGDVTIYSSHQHLDGWQRGYEEVMDDGQNTLAVRFKNGSSISPNGSHIFVRDSSGFPKRPKDFVASGVEIVDPNAGSHGLDGNRLVPDDGSGRFAATIDRSGNVTLVGEDLGPAVQLRSAVLGVRDVDKLKTETGTFNFSSTVAPTEDGAMLKLSNGMRSSAARTDRPQKQFERAHGFEFDPGYRIGKNETRVLSQDIQDELTGTVQKFMDSHGDAIRRFRLTKISVSDSPDPDMLAHTTVGIGGEIVLNKNFWDNPELLMETTRQSRVGGYLSPRVPVGPAGLLAHEMGHVLLGAARLQENMVKKSTIVKRITDELGGYHKMRRAAAEISETAASSIEELVAESVSEVMVGTPSVTALKVYGILTEYLDEGLELSRTVNRV